MGLQDGYGFSHAGKVFTPDGARTLTPDTVTEHNAQIERGELASWAGKPDRALGYYSFPEEGPDGYRATSRPRQSGSPAFKVPTKGATVTTWPGTVIGRITEAKVYRHNLGGRFVSLRVLGTNGAEYWGRASWDGGNCVVLRKVRAVR